MVSIYKLEIPKRKIRGELWRTKYLNIGINSNEFISGNGYYYNDYDKKNINILINQLRRQQY